MPTTTNNARTRRRLVRNLELWGLLYASGWVISVSTVCSTSSARTREERAGVFFTEACALFELSEGFCLFVFFNRNLLDLYSGSIRVAWVTRRDRHQHI